MLDEKDIAASAVDGLTLRDEDGAIRADFVERVAEAIEENDAATLRLLVGELQALAPIGSHRMGANPHANGGTLKRKLELPDYRLPWAHVHSAAAWPLDRPAL